MSASANPESAGEEQNFLPFISYRSSFILKKALQPGELNFKAQCVHCKNSYGAGLTSRSNLREHLKRKHPIALTTIENEESRTPKRLKDNGQAKVPKKLFFERREVSQARLDELVVRVVVENRLPFMFVGSSSFRDLVQELMPVGRTLMCEKTLRRRITSRLEAMKEQIKQSLDKVDKVCVTSDAWKSRRKGYVAVTVHWLNEDNLERQSAALALRRVKGSQTFDVLADLMESVFTEYRIENKISTAVTDNGSNFCKAFRVFGENPEELRIVDEDDDEQEAGVAEGDDDEPVAVDIDEIITRGLETGGVDTMLRLPKHRRCASHTLCRVAVFDVEKVIKDMGGRPVYRTLKAKCKALWYLQSHSTKGYEAVKEKLGTLFPVPNDTRWNSKYDAMKNISEKITSKPRELRELMVEKGIDTFTINETTWLREYVEVMQPLADALDILQQEKNVCVGYLLPTLHRLLQTMATLQDKPLRYMRPVAQCVEDSVRERFAQQLWDKDLVVAASLVLFNRLDWIQNYVVDADEEKVDEARRWVLAAARDLDSELEDNRSPTASASVAAEPETSKESSNAFHRFFGHSQSRQPRASIAVTARDQAASYLLGSMEIMESVLLRKLYIKYNTCIPSSAPVERLFSKAKLILVPGRSNLSDSNFEGL